MQWQAILAVTLVAGLMLAAWAIGLIGARHRTWAKPLAAAFMLLFLGLAVHHTGGFGTVQASWLEGQTTTAGQVPEQKCAELVALLRDNGILADGSDEQTVRVRSAYWNQLPPAVRNVAVTCLETARELEAGTLKALNAMDDAPEPSGAGGACGFSTSSFIFPPVGPNS